MNYDGDKPTMIEEDHGTMYCIGSCCNPEKSDDLFQEVIFNMRTRGPIHLEDNLSMFILQHDGSSDLNKQGEGSVMCFTEYHKTDAATGEKKIRIAAIPITEARNIGGMTGHSSGMNLVQARRSTSRAVYRLAFQGKPIME